MVTSGIEFAIQTKLTFKGLIFLKMKMTFFNSTPEITNLMKNSTMLKINLALILLEMVSGQNLQILTKKSGLMLNG